MEFSSSNCGLYDLYTWFHSHDSPALHQLSSQECQRFTLAKFDISQLQHVNYHYQCFYGITSKNHKFKIIVNWRSYRRRLFRFFHFRNWHTKASNFQSDNTRCIMFFIEILPLHDLLCNLQKLYWNRLSWQHALHNLFCKKSFCFRKTTWNRDTQADFCKFVNETFVYFPWFWGLWTICFHLSLTCHCCIDWHVSVMTLFSSYLSINGTYTVPGRKTSKKKTNRKRKNETELFENLVKEKDRHLPRDKFVTSQTAHVTSVMERL